MFGDLFFVALLKKLRNEKHGRVSHFTILVNHDIQLEVVITRVDWDTLGQFPARPQTVLQLSYSARGDSRF